MIKTAKEHEVTAEELRKFRESLRWHLDHEDPKIPPQIRAAQTAALESMIDELSEELARWEATH